MNINRVIKNEMDKSNGKVKIVSCKKKYSGTGIS